MEKDKGPAAVKLQALLVMGENEVMLGRRWAAFEEDAAQAAFSVELLGLGRPAGEGYLICGDVSAFARLDMAHCLAAAVNAGRDLSGHASRSPFLKVAPLPVGL